jgi:hypothetical protein
VVFTLMDSMTDICAARKPSAVHGHLTYAFGIHAINKTEQVLTPSGFFGIATIHYTPLPSQIGTAQSPIPLDEMPGTQGWKSMRPNNRINRINRGQTGCSRRNQR